MKTMTEAITTASIATAFRIADYSDAVIRISGIWNGNVEFYATNSIYGSESLYGPIAVQDIESTNWTTAVTSEAGASPSLDIKTFRVPVSGLTEIIVKSASGFSGSISITVTAVSNTNAR